MWAVVTAGLSKSYGPVPALSDLTMEVPEGSLFGFLGPNGAGKTTTIRILLGLLRPSAGRAAIFARDAWQDGTAVRANVGYLPGDLRLYDHLTGAETLSFMAGARGVNAAAEIRRLADMFDIDLNRRVRDCSRGMKQKIGIMQALMHRPPLLILDEPTTALDPLVRQTLFQELRQAVGDGRTVLFSSHNLGEVAALCDSVAILRAGRLVEQSRIDVLRARAVRHVEIWSKPQQPLSSIPAGLRILHEGNNHAAAAWTGPVSALLSWAATADLHDITIAPPDLEDLFLAYYDKRAGAVATP